MDDTAKRIKPRYQLALAAEVWVRGLEHRNIEKTANISTTGLFLCTDLDLPKNDVVHLRIIFKDLDAYFDVKAKVVWQCHGNDSHPKGIGLRYTDLSIEQTQLIDRYLKQYVNINS